MCREESKREGNRSHGSGILDILQYCTGMIQKTICMSWSNGVTGLGWDELTEVNSSVTARVGICLWD